MSLLKFIDKKFSSEEQIIYLRSYLLFGAPLGYIFVEAIKYFFLSKYNFNFVNLIGTIITDLIIASPFIINFFKHKKKYKKMFEKIKLQEDKGKKMKVKALFDYKYYTKGEIYNLDTREGFGGSNVPLLNIFVFDKNDYYSYNLKDNINKFDLDDIKEERLKKLKRLSKVWKN